MMTLAVFRNASNTTKEMYEAKKFTVIVQDENGERKEINIKDTKKGIVVDVKD